MILNTQIVSYNRLGQHFDTPYRAVSDRRLSMDAAGVIAHYVMDTSTFASTGSAQRLSASSDRPLTAETGGNTTFYLYGPSAGSGWGVIGEITISARYTPCPLRFTLGVLREGDTLETYGTGNPSTGFRQAQPTSSGQAFTFGYPSIELRAGFGGVLDAATGLIYVGNGQYGVYPERSRRDPATGRFLTREVYPNSPNPYVPWNPIGVIVGPLGLIALIFGRRKKGSKAGMLLVLVVVVGSVGMTIAAYSPAPAPTMVAYTSRGAQS